MSNLQAHPILEPAMGCPRNNVFYTYPKHVNFVSHLGVLMKNLASMKN